MKHGDVVQFLQQLGYPEYAIPLTASGFACMKHMYLICLAVLKKSGIVDGHALRSMDAPKRNPTCTTNHRYLGVKFHTPLQETDGSGFSTGLLTTHREEALGHYKLIFLVFLHFLQTVCSSTYLCSTFFASQVTVCICLHFGGASVWNSRFLQCEQSLFSSPMFFFLADLSDSGGSMGFASGCACGSLNGEKFPA